MKPEQKKNHEKSNVFNSKELKKTLNEANICEENGAHGTGRALSKSMFIEI